MTKELNRKPIAKTTENLATKNVALTLQAGKTSDLHWNLEKAIEDALLYVETVIELRLRETIRGIVKEFDEESGNLNQ